LGVEREEVGGERGGKGIVRARGREVVGREGRAIYRRRQHGRKRGRIRGEKNEVKGVVKGGQVRALL